MTIKLADGVSVEWEQWLVGGNDDARNMPSAYETFSPLVKAGDFVVDIGAFTGDYTIPMALLAGPSGKVLAFEPNPYSFPFLLKNIALNSLANVECHNVAIMPEDATYTFHYAENGFINGGYVNGLQTPMDKCRVPHVVPLSITGRKLGPYLSEGRKINFLKIDTEGFDHHIMESISEIIERDRPVIMTEVFTDLTTMERSQFCDIVESLGYLVGTEPPSLRHFLDDQGAYDIILYPR